MPELVGEPGVGECYSAIGVFADEIRFELFEYVC